MAKYLRIIGLHISKKVVPLLSLRYYFSVKKSEYLFGDVL